LENEGPGHEADGVEEGLDIVPHMSGIRLTFTRSQEGAQPGWLTQTGQTNVVFDTM